ncbi:MAG: MarR family transcriptional regulator [Clostridia bacterium]|nr:MarR family transcriptional regulator [Clostridia bacterium]
MDIEKIIKDCDKDEGVNDEKRMDMIGQLDELEDRHKWSIRRKIVIPLYAKYEKDGVALCKLPDYERSVCIHLYDNQGGNIKMADIQAALGAKGPSISRVFNELEKKGLVERTLDKTDRRRVIPRLTEYGKVTVVSGLDYIRRHLTDYMFTFLTEDDISEMMDCYKKLNKIYAKLKPEE